MNAGEATSESVARPTLLTHLSVATAAALIVFAGAGFFAHADSVRDILLPSGILHTSPLRSADVAFAKESLGSRSQFVRVDGSSGSFVPNQITLQSGRPVDIEFTRGKGCTSLVTFDDPAITADLSKSGATVSLPALDAGIYPFQCSHGHPAGILVVQ